MSHVQGYTASFQNLLSLVKTLKIIGFRKLIIEKKKLENTISSIHLVILNFIRPFSISWNGYKYNLVSETDLLFSSSQLTDQFFKIYTMNVITQQSSNFAFQFCLFSEKIKSKNLQISRFFEFEKNIFIKKN